MRLGISYNFFNGEEHLIPSLKSVRASAHNINVVFQELSNSGEQATAMAHASLQEACAKGLVDRVFIYRPNFEKSRQENERCKRRIGLSLSRATGCSHFLGMDADEFYRGEQLETAKGKLISDRINISTVASFFHVRRPIYRCRDETNVAFICRINFLTRVGVNSYPAGMVDPTRQTSTFPARHHLFDPRAVAMYHMNFVRQSYGSKFRNTSTTDRDFLLKLESSLKSWRYPNGFTFPGRGAFHVDLVDNEFRTFDPGG